MKSKLSKAAAAMGRARSPRKSAAARANGAKGGRPRKLHAWTITTDAYTCGVMAKDEDDAARLQGYDDWNQMRDDITQKGGWVRINPA